ncbi:MAG TPA: DUF4249 domain-containing protein [Chitinophagaceae bacterium]
MRIFISALIVSFLFSCTKPRDVQLPEHDPQLVLHGYVAVGDTFKIALGKTLQTPALAEEEETYVKNGWAALYNNGLFADSLIYDDQEKRYIARMTKAVAGNTYTVSAGAPGFESVEATVVTPLPVTTVSLTRTKGARRTAGGLLLDDIKFTINDPGTERNFYLSSLHSSGRRSLTCVYTYDPVIEQASATVAPFEQGNCIDNDALQYNDNTFNGSIRQIIISADSEALDSFPLTNGTVYRPYLKRYHVTEDYYRYFRSAYDQGLVLEEGPTFLQPRMIRGNVKNGYGLFTVFSVVTDTIR